MEFWKRWRWWAILVLPVAVIALNSFGPDGWREPLVRLLWLSWTAVAMALTHSARKALFDYAHGRQAWIKAMEDPVGAGLAFLGLCLVTAVLFFGLVSFARAETPDGRLRVLAAAVDLAPMAVTEIERIWPDMPRRSYLGTLIEKESRWRAGAQLKTSREEGAGLGQLTRAWSANGALRFDALQEVKALAPDHLGELSWANVYLRADLGLRATLVKLRDCDTRLQRLGEFERMERVALCDAAYNGGWGGLQQDRKRCALTTGCDPARWFDHVEHTSGKSRTKWQGYGRSAFDINRGHVRATVPVEQRLRYMPLLGV
jgi:hypothetical protein